MGTDGLNTKYPVPFAFQKAYEKTLDILSDCHVILELVDARIPRSSSNLLDYENNPKLKDIPRIVRFTFVDRADPVIYNEWIRYFRLNNIVVFDADINVITSSEVIVKKLIDNNLIPYNFFSSAVYKKPLKIGVVGIPKIGRQTFFENVIFDIKQPLKLSSLLNFKAKTYWLSDDMVVIDTPPVLGWRFPNSSEAFWNMQILNKVVLETTETSGLALNSFLQIAKLAPGVLQSHYGITVTSAMVSSKNSSQLILEAFNKIAIDNNLRDEFNNISITGAFDRFLQDIRSGKIGQFCLEKLNEGNA